MYRVSDLYQDIYRPRQVAKLLGISPSTIQTHMDNGKLGFIHVPNVKYRRITRDQLIAYLEKANMLLDDSEDMRHDVIYTRVSTNRQKNRGDLERQEHLIVQYMIDKHPQNVLKIQDVGSGLNDNRKGLNRLINLVLNRKVKRIFITHCDRLTRFGFNYLMSICNKMNTEIIVIHSDIHDLSSEEELAQDIVSIIHSFSGKLSGLRKQVREKIEKELSD